MGNWYRIQMSLPTRLDLSLWPLAGMRGSQPAATSGEHFLDQLVLRALVQIGGELRASETLSGRQGTMRAGRDARHFRGPDVPEIALLVLGLECLGTFPRQGNVQGLESAWPVGPLFASP